MTTNQFNSLEADEGIQCEPSQCEGRKIIEAVFGQDVAEESFSARDCSAVGFEAQNHRPAHGLVGKCGLVIRTMIQAHEEGRI